MKRIHVVLLLIAALGIIMLCHMALADTLTLPSGLTAVEDETFCGGRVAGRRGPARRS